MATVLEPLEGKYEILEKIREGGMGSVYKVRHRLLDELRVVKVMRPQLAKDEVLRARFLREAKVAIKLRHPNLAQIYDFTVDDGGYAYLVMEFIDGLNLEEIIKILGRPPLGLVLEIADQSLDAIGYLHRKRIIHRDISPDNLLVTRDEDRPLLVKLIDLGIAKDRDVEDSLTSAGTFLGKVRYSSPEHFRTHEGASIGVRSDLYSFGVVLYEMLTGTYPIRGSSVASLISGHLMHPPRPFTESDPEGLLPEGVRQVVSRALAKTPDERYASATDFREALAPYRTADPVDESALGAVFDVPTITTRRIPIVKPGSTQSRMDRNFKMKTTPPPKDLGDSGDDLQPSTSDETRATPGGRRGGSGEHIDAQVRALLLGASKLTEGEHFDEARLQLASVLELCPGNEEAVKLQRTIDAADRKMQQRRQRSAVSIRRHIQAERFDRAEADLDTARRTLGPADLFDELGCELDEARSQLTKRAERLREIDTEVAELLAEQRFERAVELLHEALRLEPANEATRARLAEAEAAHADQVEAERREREIECTAERIAGHVEAGDDEAAERELAMAGKIYGEHPKLDEAARQLEDLRARRLRDEGQQLCRRARDEIESGEFADAIATLELAREIAAELPDMDELLAAAREGLQIQREAEQRRLAIEEVILQVDRLVLAGRPQTAGRFIDGAVETLGDFDEADQLRERAANETARVERGHSEVEAALQRALDLSSEDKFADAEEQLDTTRALVSEWPEMASRVAETEHELRRRVEAHRRRMAIDDVVDSVNKQLESGAIEEARRSLAVAQRLYDRCDPLDELGASIATRERELRRAEVRALAEAARGRDREIEDVLGDLEKAATLDPFDEEVRRLLAQARAARARAGEEQNEARAAEDLDEIDRLIAAGDSGRALEALERAVTRCGDFAAARILRHRLSGRTPSAT